MIKDNILDVLSYMFDYLFESTPDSYERVIDDASIKQHLSQVGFTKNKIDKALMWLEGVAALQDGKIKQIPSKGGVRIYTKEEQNKLGLKIIGLLTFMESIGQLKISEREAIIAQVMDLEQGDIDVDDIKWVVLMILGDSISADYFEALAYAREEHTLQ